MLSELRELSDERVGESGDWRPLGNVVGQVLGAMVERAEVRPDRPRAELGAPS